MDGYIHINYAELTFFESPKHFKQWLLELHAEYDLEEIKELKQACLDLNLDKYYLVCKEFEQKYLKMA